MPDGLGELGGPRSRNRSAPDVAATSPTETAADGEDSDEGGEAWEGPATGRGLFFLLHRPGAASALGAWTTCLACSGVAVLATRGEVDGHLPPLLIPADGPTLAATLALLSVLLAPWALLTWGMLRSRRSRWGWPDAVVVASIWVASCGGAYCLLSAREKPTSGILIAGTTVFGLVGLSVAVLPVVRAATALAAALLGARAKAAWSREPCAARVALAAAAAAALWSGFRPTALQQVELHVPGLAAAGDGYALCMVSDLHAGPTTGADRLAEIAEGVRGAGCRALVFNGDMAEGTVEERKEEMQELASLARAMPDGAFYVPGNHEFYNFAAPGGGREAAAAWTRWWAAQGVRPLNNSRVQLPPQDGSGWFVLAGVDDPLGHPNLAAALPPPRENSQAEGQGQATEPEGRELPVVLAAHRPMPHAALAARRGVAVQLSGHTHGGQLWPVHLPAQRAAEGYLSGLYDVDGMKLYVSDGTVGSYMTRLRLFTQAEITRVVLRAHPCAGPGWRQADLGIALFWASALLVVTSTVVTINARFCASGAAKGAHHHLEADEGP